MLKSILCKIIILAFLFCGSAVWGANLITNGDFESGSVGWVEWNSPGGWVSDIFGHDYTDRCDIWPPQIYPIAGNGTHCQHVGTDRVHGGLYQVINVEKGQRYSVSGLWSGGGGGLNDGLENVLYSAWFEVVVFHGAVSEEEIDSGLAPSSVIAKKEFEVIGKEDFYFEREAFMGTFRAQTSQVTLVMKTGKYGFWWDAIAAYHDNIEINIISPWLVFIPAVTSAAAGK